MSRWQRAMIVDENADSFNRRRKKKIMWKLTWLVLIGTKRGDVKSSWRTHYWSSPMLYTAEICNFILSAEYFQILGVVTSAVDEFTTIFFFFFLKRIRFEEFLDFWVRNVSSLCVWWIQKSSSSPNKNPRFILIVPLYSPYFQWTSARISCDNQSFSILWWEDEK